MSWIVSSGKEIRIAVRLIPRARRNGIDGLHGDALKIRLSAPPVDGKANEALVRFLAEALDVPANAVVILRGHTSRDKTVGITGIDEADARRKLGIE